MLYHVCANLILILHFAFVGFVLFGGLLVLRWRNLLWLHLAAVLWGVLTEFIGIVCPLTPLEIQFRELAGDAGYQGSFIEHYITAVLYPHGLTREMQIWLGIAALVPNAVIYGYLFLRKRRDARRRHETT